MIATGETHTIGELLTLAFAAAGIDDWKRLVESDPRFTRPAEVDILTGDASKARDRLGWKPKVDFPELVRMMVENDLAGGVGRHRPPVVLGTATRRRAGCPGRPGPFAWPRPAGRSR